MKREKSMTRVFVLMLMLASSTRALAQPERIDGGTSATLDAQREKRAVQIFLKEVAGPITRSAEAMPAVKYAFAPIDGEFKGVRTFGQMVKHLAATNHILAAAALGEDPPADAGDEMGPEAARTKPEIVEYLNGSFAHLAKAMDAVGGQDAAVSPLPSRPCKAPPQLVSHSGGT
jgi:hypothetical protein